MLLRSRLLDVFLELSPPGNDFNLYAHGGTQTIKC